MNQQELFSLKGKVVVITGGYGHLGKNISIGLAQFDAKVIVLGRSKKKFEAAFKNHTALSIDFVKLDISSSKSIRTSFGTVLRKYEKIDVLVNNAHYISGQEPLAIDDKNWEHGIDGTLNSVYRCIREVSPYMIIKKSGRIINVASMYGMVSPNFEIYKGHEAFLNPPHYGAAKAGVIQLSRYFAVYLARYNILVNSVSPGPFPNENVQRDKRFIKTLRSKTPLGRIGTPDELKGVFILLSSDASSYITGQNFVVDGGWTSW